MKQFILLQINEEKTIVDTQSFTTLKQAQRQMREDYEQQLLENGDPQYDHHGEFFNYDNVEDNSIKEHWAHIYFRNSIEGIVPECHWEIHEQNIPTTFVMSILDTICNSLINVSLLTEERFAEIFNEPGKPDFSYLHTRFKSNDFHTFYNSLDETNRTKLTNYLLTQTNN